MIRKIRRLLVVGFALFLSVHVFAYQPSPGQGSFQGTAIPIDQLPPSEQLPAAPLVIAAYAFAWIAVFFYVWTVWRRLNKVETEMRALERRQAHGGQGAAALNRTQPR